MAERSDSGSSFGLLGQTVFLHVPSVGIAAFFLHRCHEFQKERSWHPHFFASWHSKVHQFSIDTPHKTISEQGICCIFCCSSLCVCQKMRWIFKAVVAQRYSARVLAWARWQTSAMDETPTRECRAPDFSKWFVTDVCWPHDEERAAQLGRNSDYLRQRGVQVVADSVDVMNIFPFLRNHEINANDVALVVIHGMCSRVGTDDNAYRATQALLRVPPGDGPITCAFGALAEF